ncbi:MAG: hypothetical protein JRN68_06805 [Nitrososphaerota archaeon]|jgi:hypothetical protein|nr:hypothetical protein [Nitrososphaerota archaeon]
MDVEKTERYTKRLQLVLALVIVLLVLLMVISGVGTLASSNVATSVQNMNKDSISIGVDYSSFNPGPIGLQPVKVSIVVLTPAGSPLTTQADQLVYLKPFSSSTGHLDFNMTLLPGAATTIQTLAKQGLGPLVSIKVSATFWGMAYTTVTFESNATLA